jgi:putative transposase
MTSARRECLDRMMIINERHLQLVPGEYAGHYNTHRQHRTPQHNLPAGRTRPAVQGTSIRCCAGTGSAA